MLCERLRAPAIIDDWEGTVGLAPVVDVLAVVRDHMTVARSVGAHHSTVVELEPVAAPRGTRDDLDRLPIKFSVTKQFIHHPRFRRFYRHDVCTVVLTV